MTIRDSLESALRAIAANKLRSALTMLGVVIGVGSVIAMIGIGEGTKKKSLAELEVMGSNRITVAPNWRRGQQRGASDSSTLKVEDVERIKARVPTVQLITGMVRNNMMIKFGAANKRSEVMGAEPQIKNIMNSTKMLMGTWFTDEDNELMERKVVLGYQVYDELFQGDNAVGASVKIGNQNFEVVGVVDYKGGSGFMNPDDQVYIPLKTAQNRLMGTKDRLNMITVQAINSELLPVTQADIEKVLFETRRSATGEELFRVFNQADTLAQIQTQSQLLSFLLAGIASVSLLVGGIGIMNIMLVSVTERTREIGLRKAIGAHNESILSQFLFESVVMCVFGGAIGVVLGAIATNVVAGILLVPPVINTTAVGLAFGFSLAVGLFFGLYPAVRASQLVPIEALRYE
ncbi:MAG: ABC transporter permease [Fimbriimonadaceae bacterium]|jgi:putative ABC transport system permease protein|nr:ABC transporter permease [Fimbriimonadaceae bacterium]